MSVSDKIKNFKETETMNTTTKTRNHEAINGRTDLYRVDPRQVKIVQGWNPRSLFDAEKLEELKESIKENGVLMPIRVKINADNEMTLIDGERRLRATLAAIEEGAEIVSIPAIVERKTISEIDALILAMTANTGEPLSIVDEAGAIKKLQNYGLKVEDIAKKLGKSVPTIYNRLRLLDASPEVLNEMEEGNLSVNEVFKIVDKSSGSIEEQKVEMEKTKEKKAKKKAAGKKANGKKEFQLLAAEMLEWLLELNQDKQLEPVKELIVKASAMLEDE
jgi:ParB family transcriptional regulator, chromosome partitioning protein